MKFVLIKILIAGSQQLYWRESYLILFTGKKTAVGHYKMHVWCKHKLFITINLAKHWAFVLADGHNRAETVEYCISPKHFSKCFDRQPLLLKANSSFLKRVRNGKQCGKIMQSTLGGKSFSRKGDMEIKTTEVQKCQKVICYKWGCRREWSQIQVFFKKWEQCC